MLDLRDPFRTKRNVWECGRCALAKADGRLRHGKCSDCGAWIIPEPGQLVGFICLRCSLKYAVLLAPNERCRVCNSPGHATRAHDFMVVETTTGGEKQMGKLSEVVVGLDWEGSPTHIVDFDPNAATVVLTGRNGDFDAIPVKENGVVVNLSLSNKTLVRALQNIPTACRLKITRSGTSYDTKYVVEKVK